MPRILSVTNIKGGVGKSITALFFANILAEENNVLLIDLDSQNSLTSFFMKITTV
jgi:chromosome partitioning protein